MNMTIDKQEAQYKPEVYQGRKRRQYNHERSRDNYQSRNKSYSRDRIILYRGRRNYKRNYRSNYKVDQEITIDMMIDEIITDKEIDVPLIDKVI